LIEGIAAGGAGLGLLVGEGLDLAVVGDVEALAGEGDITSGEATDGDAMAAVLLVVGCGVAALPIIPTINAAATTPVRIHLVR
jgi:hypothetical protein